MHVYVTQARPRSTKHEDVAWTGLILHLGNDRCLCALSARLYHKQNNHTMIHVTSQAHHTSDLASTFMNVHRLTASRNHNHETEPSNLYCARWADTGTQRCWPPQNKFAHQSYEWHLFAFVIEMLQRCWWNRTSRLDPLNSRLDPLFVETLCVSIFK